MRASVPCDESVDGYAGAMITAIVFIQADVSRLTEIAESIADISGVSEVYSVTGDLDLLAMVRVRTHEEISDVVADKLNKVDGVLSTQTQIAFQTFSHHDLEEAFSIGL
jgi:DNA-binding Lrp family transcriptional regulator